MQGARPQATVLLSGGIDSAACAYLLSDRNYSVENLFVDYGQAAAELEHQAATAVSAHLGVPLRTIRTAGTDAFGTGELIGRNAFFVFTALFFTHARPGLIALGLHAGTPYYDCSESFAASVSKLVSELTNGRVSVFAPFLTWSKKDVYDYFISKRIPLGLTYSCEAGQTDTCGICSSCSDRKLLGC